MHISHTPNTRKSSGVVKSLKAEKKNMGTRFKKAEEFMFV